MAPHVRTATSSDAPFVEELARRLFLSYGSYDRYFIDWFENEDVVTVVADVDGRAAGLAMFLTRSSEKERKTLTELLAIAVTPELQRRGVGTALLEEGVRLASIQTTPYADREMHLSVADGNARAERLFSRHGFRRTGELGVYPLGQRALLMMKRLQKKMERTVPCK